jgi:hypothetical protein
MRKGLGLSVGVAIAVVALWLVIAMSGAWRIPPSPRPPQPPLLAAAWNRFLPIPEVPKGPDPVAEMRSYVEQFTGRDATDCGQHLLTRSGEVWASAGVDILKRSLACGVDARRQGKPFWAFKQHQGTDSWIAEGLLGTPGGAVYRFSYDSAPCGGPSSRCAGTFAIARCDAPTVEGVRPGLSSFRCAESSR